ncbi:hypothetical protein TSUD_41690 [Trifolium subterraneum]|nr:hypothetical protein TSUD_41690 [Trifolium subterraneum]
MHEEGWVVCRAFKKPSPSHRPGYEPWYSNSNQHQQPQYFRDDQNYATTRPLSMTDILHENRLLLQHNPTTEEGTSFSHNFSNDQQFLSNQTTLVMDNKQLIELPQLDSPTTSFAIKECTQNGFITNEDQCSDERSNNGSQIQQITFQIH